MTVHLGVDWGSTHLRVHYIENGEDRGCIHADTGAKELIGQGEGAFCDALRQAVGPWITQADHIYVTGMATSKNAWVETPYLDCPGDLRNLADLAEMAEIDGTPVTLLPGIADPMGPDVMRGEELQLLGLAEEGRDRVIVLPGTHSKWVEMSGHKVTQFRTHMTGEIFALARHHSLCGRLAEGEGADDQAFDAGLQKSSDGLLNGLFSARPRVLRGQMEAAATHAFLSGVAIGTELREALSAFDTKGKEVLLYAAAPLADLYERAFGASGVAVTRIHQSATAIGFQRL